MFDPVTFNPRAILSRFSLSLFCLTAVAPNMAVVKEENYLKSEIC